MKINAVTVAALSLLVGVAGCGGGRRAGADYGIYVTNEASGDLTVIDGASRAVISTVPLGKRPRGVKATADGAGLLIALSGSAVAPPGTDESTLPPPDKAEDGIGLYLFDLNRIQRVLRGVSNPEQAVTSAAGRIYAPCEDRGSVIVLDATSGQTLAELPVGEEPEGVAVSPDGKQVYVALEGDNKVAVIDADAKSVIKRIDVGKRPRSIAFSPDGAKAYVTNEVGGTLSVIDTRSQAVTNTIAIPGVGAKPMGVVVSPDGGRVYVTTGRGGEAVAVGVATGAVLGAVKVGPRPWGVAISPDGKFLVTANGPSNDVSIVSTDTMTLTTKIKVGQHPWGVAIAPLKGKA
jgi:YVTN family beta-propeller protein